MNHRALAMFRRNGPSVLPDCVPVGRSDPHPRRLVPRAWKKRPPTCGATSPSKADIAREDAGPKPLSSPPPKELVEASAPWGATRPEDATDPLPAPGPEPTGEPSAAAAPPAPGASNDDDIGSIFRSRIGDAQNSIWSGELGSMLSLKRANPIYDSDSEDEDDCLGSPFKRLRHVDDSSGLPDDVRDAEEDSSKRSLSPASSLIRSQHAFFLPESMWKTSRSEEDIFDDSEGSPVLWTDRTADDDDDGFAIMPSTSVLSVE